MIKHLGRFSFIIDTDQFNQYFRTITVPTKRLVSKTLYRVVERCCEGWTGDDCMTGTLWTSWTVDDCMHGQ